MNNMQEECEFLLGAAITYADNCLQAEMPVEPCGLAMLNSGTIASVTGGASENEAEAKDNLFICLMAGAVDGEYKVTAAAYLDKQDEKTILCVEVDHKEGHSFLVKLPVIGGTLSYEEAESEEGKYRVFGKLEETE